MKSKEPETSKRTPSPQKQTPQGADRRRNFVYCTRNKEYHFRDHICVGVKDTHSKTWIPFHLAVSRPLHSALRFASSGRLMRKSNAECGDALCFLVNGLDIITSAITCVRRSSPEDAALYPQLLPWAS